MRDLLEKETEELKERFGTTCPTYEYICESKILQLIEPLYTFFRCEWWQRVWTWQEMILPVGEVRFTAETDIHPLQTNNTITRGELRGFNDLLGSWTVPDSGRDNNKLAALNEVSLTVLGIIITIGYKDYGIGKRYATLSMVILSLLTSKRRCYDPCDYVYGVLGVLQIKIPRMTDPDAVWRRFLSVLEDIWTLPKGRWFDYADEIDLRQVENIGEVCDKLYSWM